MGGSDPIDGGRHAGEASTKVAAVLLGLATFDRAAATEPISIVALGASGIHGKGVALSEAFPAQLENMLRADGLAETFRKNAVDPLSAIERIRGAFRGG
jgi:hypothetical protein